MRTAAIGSIVASFIAMHFVACTVMRESSTEKSERQACEGRLSAIDSTDGISAGEAEFLADCYYRTQHGLCFEQGKPVDGGPEWRVRICGGYGGCSGEGGEPHPYDPSQDIRIDKRRGEIRYGSNSAMSLAEVITAYREFCFEISRDPPPASLPDRTPRWQGGGG